MTDFEDRQNNRKIPPDARSTSLYLDGLRRMLTIVTGSFLPPPTTQSASSTKRYLWTLSFYAQFFDVDTGEVLRRCSTAIFPRANFLDVLEGNPDLYGPFWIATTVIVILFLTGTISQYLSRKGEGHFAYDFRLLSGEHQHFRRDSSRESGT